MPFGTPCTTCGSATAIGRSKAGELVRVCAMNGHTEIVEAARKRPARELASPWWAA